METGRKKKYAGRATDEVVKNPSPSKAFQSQQKFLAKKKKNVKMPQYALSFEKNFCKQGQNMRSSGATETKLVRPYQHKHKN